MAKRSREDSPPAATTDTPSPTPSSLTSNAESNTPPTSAATTHDSHSSKYLQVPNDLQADNRAAMKCSLAPHTETLSFSTFEEFEIHYAQVHTNRCSECQKNFPTAHFLDLHIGENHDPLVAARRARDEKTYRCFVEGCDKVCSTPPKRKMHLQAKHFFPKDYDYFIVNDGIDKRSSMLRTRHRRGSSAVSRAIQRGQKSSGTSGQQISLQSEVRGTTSGNSSAQSVVDKASTERKSAPSPSSETHNQDIDELTSTMSALKFVPPSVRFGRGGHRAGLGRH